MPLRECSDGDMPGVKWGEAGACYSYTAGDEESRKEAVRKALAQAVAMCDLPTDRMIHRDAETRAVELVPTQEVADEAARGLALYEEGKGGDGLVDATIADARAMATREALSEDKVRAMPGWFARHEGNFTRGTDDQPGEETPAYVAWLLWGGDAGREWSERKVEQMDAEEERSAPELRDDDAEWMTPRQKVLYKKLDDIAETFGPWDGSTGPDGAHYMDAEANPFKGDGLVCSSCAFYRGGGGCEIVGQQVAPEGLCRFWIVPADPLAVAQPEVEGDDEELVVDADTAEREIAYHGRKAEWRESGAGKQYRTVAGYAVVWDAVSLDLGGFKETFKRGAFTEALAQKPDIRLLYNHDSAYVLARSSNGTLEVEEDEIGLRVWARVDMNDPHVRMVAAKLENGTVDQMSFAFTTAPDGDEWSYKGDYPMRTVRKVEMLYETSVVSMPAYESTRVGILERAVSQGRVPSARASRVAPADPAGVSSQVDDLGRDTKDQSTRAVAAKWRARLERKRKEAHIGRQDHRGARGPRRGA
jgi:hypothetical protein